MEVTEKEAKELAKYIMGVNDSANKFSNYIQATATMFDMNIDEMCLAVANLTEATIQNLLRDGSDESVVKTLEYIDAVSRALDIQKDAIMKKHMMNRKG